MFGFYNIAQWNLPEQPPLVSNHLTQIWIGSSVSQIAISETSHKRPPPISNHLSLKSRVVPCRKPEMSVVSLSLWLPCRRFHCAYIICSEFSMYNFLWRGEEQKRQRRLSITVAELRVRRNNRDALVQWASESSVFLVQLLILLFLWASWKELKEQVCYAACPEKNVQRNYVLNVYLWFGWVSPNSHLSHWQNNLSLISGHHVFLHPALMSK